MSAAASCTRLYRSTLAPRFLETFRVASACLRKAPRTAEAFRSGGGRGGSVTEKAGCPDDVRTTMQTSCQRCQEVHFRVQILIETKIWTLTFCPLPKVRKRWEVFRNDKDSEQNLSRICGEVAEWMQIYSIWIPCLVHALVDARFKARHNTQNIKSLIDDLKIAVF